MAQLRTRKDGGCSICYASDENVGKRRCCHVLDNAAMAVRKEKGMNFVDISGNTHNGDDTTISIKASEKKIEDFITSLYANGVPKKKRPSLLEAMRNMQ